MKRNETARKLFTKVVNALTAKMEIGAPMACLFLLGNPDHYTDHKFKTFYWKSYVRQVMQASLNNTDIVQDYMYRPTIYHGVNLYDWIRRSDKSTIASHKKKKKNVSRDKNVFHDQLENEEFSDAGTSEDEMHQNQYIFLPAHPQSETHQVRMKSDDPFLVPDFVGGALPHSDHGDREYYCATMLTLFKPWRNGKEMRSEQDSWDKTFINHKFTPRQIEIMNYFNVRYECLDAQDDYSAQRNQEGDREQAQHWASYGHWDALDDNYEDELADNNAFPPNSVQNDHDNIDYEQPSHQCRVRNEKMQTAENVVRMAGWLDKCVDGTPDVGNLESVEPEVDQPPKSWKAAVQAKKTRNNR
ncbi:hypothetical protein PILCRDRAFT_76676 [Piloderma croceum F 1598]|uniref:Uncharacterized protein n=1 Tax=Piloderma croceum (strain F 1598) TaxID=765440 RepID=A0A0C3EYD8_PILCF|nr:hypothetical protein PILCRDRAFT_76676 [Piloderma croceum F 1598]